MDLDPSELEGALIVPSQDLAPLSPSAQALTTRDTRPVGAHILSETEIRERKKRRARLAHEADYISLDDGGSESDSERNRVTKPKKSESRLIAEDEDLGEGYDEFVSDGGLALGRRAERDAARRHRQEMAELIHAAEDNNSSDDGASGERGEPREIERYRVQSQSVTILTTSYLHTIPTLRRHTGHPGSSTHRIAYRFVSSALRNAFPTHVPPSTPQLIS
jgi:hypothetical protein